MSIKKQKIVYHNIIPCIYRLIFFGVTNYIVMHMWFVKKKKKVLRISTVECCCTPVDGAPSLLLAVSSTSNTPLRIYISRNVPHYFASHKRIMEKYFSCFYHRPCVIR